MEAGREFQFLEVIGTNVLADEVVRHVWPRKSVGNRRNACYAQSTLWGELLNLTHQSTCRDGIYSKGKAQRQFLRWASESRESVREESSICLMARFWVVSGVAREYLEAPLHRWEPYSRQGRIWALYKMYNLNNYVRRCKGVKNRLDLNKKPIILAADFATEEMCSFQERSDAT